ncbi:MAG: methyltransferase domain-containing protein [Oscillospiraceae bacterium]|nr:methyltransferase domain-containing protein [Oscillospiraceae bacterium]
MNAYGALAASYDRLTNDVDYKAWVDFAHAILEKEGLKVRTVADLACGTGSATRLLAQRGYRVTAVDLSEDMLTEAMDKCGDLENLPTFVHQNLAQLKLPRAVDMAVCFLDSLDYILNPDDCAAAICQTYRALNPGGIFIFDVNTPEKLRAMDGQVFLDEDDDVYCIWRGEFDGETNICSYGMDLFQREGDVWVRSFEEHQEYAYSIEQLKTYLKQAGFTRIEVYADRLFCAPREGEQRVWFKARKGVVKHK